MSLTLGVVWQQPPKTHVNHHQLDDKHNECANNTNQLTQGHENKQINDVASHTSPSRAFQLQSSGTATEQFRKKSGNEQVLFPDDPNKCLTDIQEAREHEMTASDGDSNNTPLTSTTQQIEERLVRDGETNDL